MMEEVRKEYNLEAPQYDEKWGHYVEQTVGETLKRVEPFLASRRGITILDVGCGTGAFFHYLRQDVQVELTMIGVDISKGMIDVATQKVPKASFVIGSASLDGMPDVQNGSVDLVVSVNSFHFWPDPTVGLIECRKKLKPGGRIIISDWNHEYWWCKFLGLWLWVRRFPGSKFYSRRETLEMLNVAGFKDTSAESFTVRGWGMFCVTGER